MEPRIQCAKTDDGVGIAYTSGQMFRRDGVQVASVVQEALICEPREERPG